MTPIASECLMLTPAGALHAFSSKTPDSDTGALQALLTGERSLNVAAWHAIEPLASTVLARALENGWVQVLQRSLQGPDARLDDFLQYVIASLSDERRAVLASDTGFCLGRAGVRKTRLMCCALQRPIIRISLPDKRGAVGKADRTTWRFTTTRNSCSQRMFSCHFGSMAQDTG